ncbi:MAG: hypothetical protein AVDCRST_MAG27-658, partial [uncultured Craurococcus sp.]
AHRRADRHRAFPVAFLHALPAAALPAMAGGVRGLLCHARPVGRADERDDGGVADPRGLLGGSLGRAALPGRRDAADGALGLRHGLRAGLLDDPAAGRPVGHRQQRHPSGRLRDPDGQRGQVLHGAGLRAAHLHREPWLRPRSAGHRPAARGDGLARGAADGRPPRRAGGPGDHAAERRAARPGEAGQGRGGALQPRGAALPADAALLRLLPALLHGRLRRAGLAGDGARQALGNARARRLRRADRLHGRRHLRDAGRRLDRGQVEAQPARHGDRADPPRHGAAALARPAADAGGTAAGGRRRGRPRARHLAHAARRDAEECLPAGAGRQGLRLRLSGAAARLRHHPGADGDADRFRPSRAGAAGRRGVARPVAALRGQRPGERGGADRGGAGGI